MIFSGEAVPKELKLRVQILSTGMIYIFLFFSAIASPGTQCPNLSDIHNFEQISKCVDQINSKRRNSSPNSGLIWERVMLKVVRGEGGLRQWPGKVVQVSHH